MNAGQRVLWLDFDSDADETFDRLQTLGAPNDVIAKLFEYRNPDSSPRGKKAAAEMLTNSYGLCVLDGVTDAMNLFQLSIKDNDDFASLNRMLLRPLARNGAAVAVIDHVSKSPDRGRFAVGAQSKMAAITGAAYVVEVASPIAPGKTGEIVLKVAKDRPGTVRAGCEGWSGATRLQVAAHVSIDSTGEQTVMTVAAPDPFESDLVVPDGKGTTSGERKNARPIEAVAEEILVTLRNHDAYDESAAMSRVTLFKLVKGKRQKLLDALDLLERESEVIVHEGSGTNPKRVHVNCE